MKIILLYLLTALLFAQQHTQEINILEKIEEKCSSGNLKREEKIKYLLLLSSEDNDFVDELATIFLDFDFFSNEDSYLLSQKIFPILLHQLNKAFLQKTPALYTLSLITLLANLNKKFLEENVETLKKFVKKNAKNIFFQQEFTEFFLLKKNARFLDFLFIFFTQKRFFFNENMKKICSIFQKETAFFIKKYLNAHKTPKKEIIENFEEIIFYLAKISNEKVIILFLTTNNKQIVSITLLALSRYRKIETYAPDKLLSIFLERLKKSPETSVYIFKILENCSDNILKKNIFSLKAIVLKNLSNNTFMSTFRTLMYKKKNIYYDFLPIVINSNVRYYNTSCKDLSQIYLYKKKELKKEIIHILKNGQKYSQYRVVKIIEASNLQLEMQDYFFYILDVLEPTEKGLVRYFYMYKNYPNVVLQQISKHGLKSKYRRFIEYGISSIEMHIVYIIKQSNFNIEKHKYLNSLKHINMRFKNFNIANNLNAQKNLFIIIKNFQILNHYTLEYCLKYLFHQDLGHISESIICSMPISLLEKTIYCTDCKQLFNQTIWLKLKILIEKKQKIRNG